MASRKEQKEQLRREREQREAEARASDRRRRLIGYGAGGAVAAVAIVLAVVLLAGGSDSGGTGEKSDEAANVLPDGGEAPSPPADPPALTEAAKAAGCELESVKGKSREHVDDLAQTIEYATSPPSEGTHFAAPADDGAYEESPDVKELVHTLEHGRVIMWFDPKLPEEQRANLRALFEEDEYHMVLTPAPAGAGYAVAASAWNREPVPNGTGRTITCPAYNDELFDALRAFKDEHRDNGPEAVP